MSKKLQRRRPRKTWWDGVKRGYEKFWSVPWGCTGV